MTPARFPFNAFTLKQADALNVLRESMSDAEVLALFPALSPARERVAGFLRRNPRPDSAGSIVSRPAAKATAHPDSAHPPKGERA